VQAGSGVFPDSGADTVCSAGAGCIGRDRDFFGNHTAGDTGRREYCICDVRNGSFGRRKYRNCDTGNGSSGRRKHHNRDVGTEFPVETEPQTVPLTEQNTETETQVETKAEIQTESEIETETAIRMETSGETTEKETEVFIEQKAPRVENDVAI